MNYRFTFYFWEKWQEGKELSKKYQITPEKIVEFAFNPDKVLPDDVFPTWEQQIKRK